MTLEELVDAISTSAATNFAGGVGPENYARFKARIKSLIAEHTTMKDGTRRCPPHLLAPHDPKFCLRCGAL